MPRWLRAARPGHSPTFLRGFERGFSVAFAKSHGGRTAWLQCWLWPGPLSFLVEIVTQLPKLQIVFLNML